MTALFIIFYLIGLVIFGGLGAMISSHAETDEDSKDGARVFWLAFIWPLALVWYLPQYLIWMWKRAEWGK